MTPEAQTAVVQASPAAALDARPRPARPRRSPGSWIRGAVPFAVLLAAWYALTARGLIAPIFLPSRARWAVSCGS